MFKKGVLILTIAFNAGKQKSPIICIGGANIDKKLYTKNEIVKKTSNPVIGSSRTVGGVARNIAENLGRLGEEVILLSARGNDADWFDIYQSSSPFMNLDHVIKIDDISTGSYTAVIDKNGDLSLALADMKVFDYITPALLLKNIDILLTAKCIVVDLNCPSETIEYLGLFTAKHHIPLVIIPVSSQKMSGLPKKMHAVSWLIVNKDETETYLNVKINDRNDWENSVKSWLRLGVRNVIVTNGSKGVMTGGAKGYIQHFPSVETPIVADVTGAGDSFCSGVIYSWLQKKDFESVIKSGLVNAHKTIMSKYTVRQELSQTQFKLDMEEFTNEKIY
ncbi:carbohydrate kinase family protein [Bacillus sp. mrc49]|uniref:carbohydrate kinase family protein n=1 Tax=Bacillus sp. mrc49 TaxID=2054913 RepID=UPI000C2781EF|nr:carbohydrate kinase family protein [Bacillus sp. mrc49]PJN88594.1 carbohydrate kinase [Bacillus sp. mrc49]